jgi:hypothetical protein
MAFFDVDFDNVAWANLPVRLRQPVQFAWLKALAAPVKYIYGLFMANRVNNLYYLAHNSQVCYMEAALNDTFDNTLRRIYITDAPSDNAIYAYLATENEPVWLGLASETGTTAYVDPLPLYTSIETIISIGFVVHVPVAALNTPYMRALVDNYRLPGRNVYSIVTF